VSEGTEPWRGGLRYGGRPVRDAVAMARGLRGCCKARDRAGRRRGVGACRGRCDSPVAPAVIERISNRAPVEGGQGGIKKIPPPPLYPCRKYHGRWGKLIYLTSLVSHHQIRIFGESSCLDACPVCKFAHADPQASADSEQVDHGDVVLATLYAAQITAIHSRFVR